MANFKAGDKVRVVRARKSAYEVDGRGTLNVGDVHTLFMDASENHGVRLVGAAHEGFWYSFNRFEPYTTPTVKVGDKVRIARKVAGRDANGMGPGVKWQNSWSSHMDKYIGHVGAVVRVAQGAQGINVKGADYFDFPLAALELVEDDSNGVDGEGNKINFTEADLKPGMRVVTGNGIDAIVFGEYETYYSKGIAIAYAGHSNWDYLRSVGFKEVYADPAKPYAFTDPSSKGKLLFKTIDFAEQQRKQAAADAAVAQAEAALKAAQDARAALK